MAFTDRLHNRGSISTGYDIDNSLKLEDDNTENLYRALNLSTSTTKFTVSMWAKRTEINGPHLLYLRGVAGNESVVLRFATESASYPEALQVDIGAGGTNSRSYTKASFRDASAWYHIVLAVDTTQSTATDRFKLYVNGVLETEYASRNNPAQNFAMEVSGAKHRHGAYNDTDGFAGYCGYIAECHYVDGLQVAQTEFGEFDDDSGIWKPKAYSGSYGTGGYYLDFSDSSALGNNSAGDGTDFTLNNITSADQATDTPTNNFCTLLSTSPSASYYKRVKDGGTSFQSVTNAWASCWSSIPLYSGKWYAEFKRTSAGTGGNIFVGAGGIDQNLYYYNIIYVGHNGTGTTFSVGLYSVNGDFYSGSGVTGSSYGSGDIICLAVDQDNGAIYFRKNNAAWMGDGTNAGDPSSGASRTGAQIIDWGTATNLAISNYGNNDETEANYGGYSCMSNSRTYTDDNGYGLFVYEPPTGYLAICSKNLAETG
jgi:hypothetical protein